DRKSAIADRIAGRRDRVWAIRKPRPQRRSASTQSHSDGRACPAKNVAHLTKIVGFVTVILCPRPPILLRSRRIARNRSWRAAAQREQQQQNPVNSILNGIIKH